MADVQIAVIDQQDTQIALAVPGVQGPIGLTGSVTIAQAGTAATPGIRFESDTNTGIYSPGADQLAVATNGTGRLFVDASGNVGVKGSTVITTSAVSAPAFQIGDGAGSPAVVMYSATTGASQISFADSTTGTGSYDGYILYNQSSQYLEFGIAASPRLRITSAGLVGIGITSPSYALHVRSAVDYQGFFENTATGTGALIGGISGAGIITSQSTATPLVFARGGTEAARIDDSGRLLVGASADSGGALLQVNGDRIRVATAKTPASATATGTAGEICWDADYIYVCTATNTWKRSAIATW